MDCLFNVNPLNWHHFWLILQPRDAIELLKTESLTGGNRKEGKHKRKVKKELMSFKFPNFSPFVSCGIFWLSCLRLWCLCVTELAMWLNLKIQNWQNDEVGVQSMEMLKVRAALEEKLKQKGAFSSFSSKPDKAQKHPRPVNGYFYCFYPP